MQEKFTPGDATASTPRDEQEEAWHRFDEASRGYYLLVGTDCRPERLKRAGEVMDLWARRLA